MTRLGRALRGFFSEHLPVVRGVSAHTTRSYRDASCLLLRFVADRTQRSVVDLRFDDLDRPNVLAFLDYLESERGNSAATRNVRLAAIHSFARYAAALDPENVDVCQRLVAIPFKRVTTSVVDYLDKAELRALLEQPDRTKPAGRRDHALLLTLFNTGARVTEVTGLMVADLHFEPPRQVRLMGKGRKERICPLWAETAGVLAKLITEHALTPTDRVFRNHRGEPLTRFGVGYILRKHTATAAAAHPGLARKRVSPHTMRHTAAVHLLQAGVDMVTISHWLGHASVETTNRYAAVDLAAKQAAIERAGPIGTQGAGAEWQEESVLTWLEKL